MFRKACSVAWGHLGVWSMDILEDTQKGAVCNLIHCSINVD